MEEHPSRTGAICVGDGRAVYLRGYIYTVVGGYTRVIIAGEACTAGDEGHRACVRATIVVSILSIDCASTMVA